MSSRRTIRTLFAAAALLTALVGGPQVGRADGVSSAEQNVKQVAADLQNLLDQLGQLDEDYAKAQDKKAKVDAEVAVSKKSVADMQQRLKGEQNILQDMAVTNFTSGGSTALSPLFSDVATYSAAEQRDALGRLALDSGQGQIDDYQSLVIDLAKEQRHLQQKQSEAAALLSYLEQKQQSYTALETTYKAKLAKAQTDLGAAKVQAAQDAYMASLAVKAAKIARARAAADAAAAAQAAQTGNYGGGGTSAPGRGGGTPANGGGGNGGGGSSGGTPAPPVHIPAVSGRAGAVVAAAISQLGTPYHFAQATPGVGFDCSGLTMWSWEHAGVSLSHSAQVQYDTTAHIPVSQAQPGDLLFFGQPAYHVAIYLGNNQLIESPEPGKTVHITDVYQTPTSIRRIASPDAAASAGATGGGLSAAQLTAAGMTPAVASFAGQFASAETRYNLPTGLLAAVAQQESGGNAQAVSSAGAQGLMQLMPSTAAGMGVNALDATQAIDAAAKILSGSLTKYNGSVPLALAAYNAGAGAVAQYGGIPPYSETQNYVRSITAMMERGA